jgi:hypothetical protein
VYAIFDNNKSVFDNNKSVFDKDLAVYLRMLLQYRFFGSLIPKQTVPL